MESSHCSAAEKRPNEASINTRFAAEEFLSRHFDFMNARFASALKQFRGDIFLLG